MLSWQLVSLFLLLNEISTIILIALSDYFMTSFFVLYFADSNNLQFFLNQHKYIFFRMFSCFISNYSLHAPPDLQVNRCYFSSSLIRRSTQTYSTKTTSLVCNTGSFESQPQVLLTYSIEYIMCHFDNKYISTCLA